jgi:5-methyltetrahydrofolate--homocysteine methyltransferase
VGEQAKSLYADALAMLERIVAEKKLEARGVFGIFPANSAGDDIVILDESRNETARFLTLRQQSKKSAGIPNLAMADFISPDEDHVGAFCVTVGFGVDDWAAEFAKDHDEYNAILVKALADRLAEAFAEWLHEKVRTEFWGYASDEKLSNDALIDEQYKGIRPAPGYPACPDHLEKKTIWKLLDVEKNTGVVLTESLAMWPAASVSGYYFAHPQAKYFGLGKIREDQLADYAVRRGIPVDEARRWLGPSLAAGL